MCSSPFQFMKNGDIRDSASQAQSLVQLRPVILVGHDQVVQDLLGYLGAGHSLAQGQCLPHLLVAVLTVGLDHQLFHGDLLIHHAQLEGRDLTLTQGLRTIVAHQTGDLHHSVGIKVTDSALVLHDAEHPLVGVVGDSAGQIHDKACMVVDVELVTLELARTSRTDFTAAGHPAKGSAAQNNVQRPLFL